VKTAGPERGTRGEKGESTITKKKHTVGGKYLGTKGAKKEKIHGQGRESRMKKFTQILTPRRGNREKKKNHTHLQGGVHQP